MTPRLFAGLLPGFLTALTVAAFALTAQAVQPDEILEDPVLEARARDLSKDIRCLVCQNESIDSSNAELAKDLRVLVRERLVAGDSDQQVLDFLVERYGDFVLLRPPSSRRPICSGSDRPRSCCSGGWPSSPTSASAGARRGRPWLRPHPSVPRSRGASATC